MDSLESFREKATTLRVIVLVIGTQLMVRAMLLLQRWNY